MTIKYNNEVIGEVITNQSMTIQEACELAGLDDAKRDYDNGKDYAYEDDGFYHYDYDNMETVR